MVWLGYHIIRISSTAEAETQVVSSENESDGRE